MELNKIFALAGLAVASMTFAGAQGFMMMGGGGGMSPGMVMMAFAPGEGPSVRADVSKELKLTDDQKSKIMDFSQKQMQEMMSRFQSGERPSQDEMQAIMKKRAEDEDKALKGILDAGQQKRLRELWIQRMGNGAIMNADLQKELSVTDEQKAKIKDLQTKQQQAGQSLREKAQNGEIDFSQIREIMQKNQKVMNEELGKLLTKDQADKLKTMGGGAFKFEDNDGGG
jgi:Spy/CpxP family protein refolding chaperone